MTDIGRLIAFIDQAGQSFVFHTCKPCCLRLDRLPMRVQSRQLDCAISTIQRHPERYWLKHFESDIEARLFIHLEAERLRSLAWSELKSDQDR